MRTCLGTRLLNGLVLLGALEEVNPMPLDRENGKHGVEEAPGAD